MNRNAIHKIFLLVLALLLASAGTLYAGKKPNITRHDATLLQNAIKITVEWQAEKPVVLLKATVGGESKEVELDEFDDNTKDRHGFYGEADVSILLEPYEAFVQKDYIPYVIQIRDNLGRKSEITGRVRVKVQEAEDTYRGEGDRYPGGMPAKSDGSGEYKTKDIVRDVLEIAKQHTAQPRKGDSDHERGQFDPNLSAEAELPVITLLPDPEGNIDVTVEANKTYEDPGAFVTDSKGNRIAELNQIDRHIFKYDEQGDGREVDSVDTTEAADYSVTYDFQDSSYGVAQRQTRWVSVLDSAAPVITLLPEGNADVTVEVKTAYKDPGAFVTDSKGNRIAELNQIDRHVYKYDEQGDGREVDSVDTTEAADYSVTYDFQDSSGKVAQRQTRWVSVLDSAAPVITLLPEGNIDVTVEVKTAYKDPGAYVTDGKGNTIAELNQIDRHVYKYDEQGNPREVDNVDTKEAADYAVTYDFQHSSGKVAQQQVRWVSVAYSAAPEDEGIESPPSRGPSEFKIFPQPGKTQGSKKPLPRIKWKGGRPATVAETQVAPPKLPPGGIFVAPPPKKKTRVIKAKSLPTGSTLNQVGSPKLPPSVTFSKPGVTQQPATQPSDDQKKPDEKTMQIQR